MRFFAITALLTLGVSALPTVDNSVLARSASAEAIAEALIESARLSARGLKIFPNNFPSGSFNCPATARYEAHTFTENQAKVAYLAGAGLNANGKQLGQSKCWLSSHTVGANPMSDAYPHKYNSNQELPNGCGTETQEFPILFSNQAYTGEDVQQVPDRVLYEASEKKGQLLIKFCGVIRHGDGRDFVNC
jgi:hypothetical protein